jgi:hypothetical protein
VHVRLDLLVQLLHRHDDVHVDDMLEVPVDARDLRGDVLADGRRDLDVVSREVEIHRQLLSNILAEVGGLYVHRLAVLGDRAARNLDALLRQDVGDAVIGERLLAVLGGDELLDERADRGRGAGAARVVETWLPKKYLSSKMPRGVSMYFCVVTREIVDSCRLTDSAISRSTSGRMATSPCSKKFFCRSTIACVTRRIVSKRCWTFLMSQRASCSCPERCLPPFSREACRMSA